MFVREITLEGSDDSNYCGVCYEPSWSEIKDAILLNPTKPTTICILIVFGVLLRTNLREDFGQTLNLF
jgi:hypothetical protein